MMKIVTTVRNNWKKSVFFASALTYGTYYLIERKRNGDLMQAYCYEALKYSREKVSPETAIKRVTVFLNPIANGERGKFLYDKNVAPLLHLSGLDVRLVRLEKNSEANMYMREIDLNDTDCIVVAGGNATLNEVISGLVNRADAKEFLSRIPIGIIPIGENNSFAHKWFTSLNDKIKRSSGEEELRLFADAAMAIIKGKTRPADLMKITLHQSCPNESVDHSLEMKKRGAYSLLKENKIFALSNISCGFVTLTDANADSYWYLGFKRFKSGMNRYFMERFLRRNPIKYEFSYKLKCIGCSKCLNKAELEKELNEVKNNYLGQKVEAKSDANSSLLRVVYKKFFKIQPKLSKEAIEEAKQKKQLKIDKLSKLIEKASINNDDCNKMHKTFLTQVQLISNINDPYDAESKHVEINNETSSIDTVIVKDPEFNAKDMFLAQKKELKEFELKKLGSTGLDKDNPALGFFAIEIDGEIYKLNNKPENHLSINVEVIENCINLLKFDEELSNSIKASPLPNIFNLSKRTLNEVFFGPSPDTNEMPPILPFEKLYLKYQNPNKQSA